MNEAGKGSKQRPTNQVNYATNYDKIFGNKYSRNMDEYKETCPYCGIKTDNPCDEPQNSCEQAINKTFGGWLNGLNK